LMALLQKRGGHRLRDGVALLDRYAVDFSLAITDGPRCPITGSRVWVGLIAKALPLFRERSKVRWQLRCHCKLLSILERRRSPAHRAGLARRIAPCAYQAREKQMRDLVLVAAGVIIGF